MSKSQFNALIGLLLTLITMIGTHLALTHLGSAQCP